MAGRAGSGMLRGVSVADISAHVEAVTAMGESVRAIAAALESIQVQIDLDATTAGSPVVAGALADLEGSWTLARRGLGDRVDDLGQLAVGTAAALAEADAATAPGGGGGRIR